MLYCPNDRDHGVAVHDPSISTRTQAATPVHPWFGPSLPRPDLATVPDTFARPRQHPAGLTRLLHRLRYSSRNSAFAVTSNRQPAVPFESDPRTGLRAR